MIPDHLTDRAEALLTTNGGLAIVDDDYTGGRSDRTVIFATAIDPGQPPTHAVIGLGPMFVHVEVAWNRDDAEAIVAELMPHPSVAQVTTLPIVDRRG